MSDANEIALEAEMNKEDREEAERDKELEQAEDYVFGIHNLILGLQVNGVSDIDTYSDVTLNNADCTLTITIDMSDVEAEALRNSIQLSSTSKYVVEKLAQET